MIINNKINNKIFLFTDHDLDGAGCYYILRHYLQSDFNFIQTSEKNFLKDFNNLSAKEQYSKIYIFDLAIFKDFFKEIDLPNVVFIHHRNLEEQENKTVLNLKNESEDYSSCTKLIYNKLKDKFKIPFTNSQKSLVALIDDYDSYTLKSPNSLKLNYLYWNFKYDKARKFFEAFSSGFNGFNSDQQEIIKDCENQFKTIYNNLKIFKGELDISGKKTILCSTFNTFAPSEICHKIIQDYDCDIVINVNLNNNYLNIRKNPKCDIHIGKLAEKLFDGGGNLKVAGGHLNKNFLTLSKQLHQIK